MQRDVRFECMFSALAKWKTQTFSLDMPKIHFNNNSNFSLTHQTESPSNTVTPEFGDRIGIRTAMLNATTTAAAAAVVSVAYTENANAIILWLHLRQMYEISNPTHRKIDFSIFHLN